MTRAESADVDRWLGAAGWLPTRDIGARAEELIVIRQADAARQGQGLAAPNTAIQFVRSFGDLELELPDTSPSRSLILKPPIGYEGDVEEILSLASHLATQLFPVAYETIEGSIRLIDASARFFYLHHTGGYFLGTNPAEGIHVRLYRTAVAGR